MNKIYHTKMADALPSKKRVAEEKARKHEEELVQQSRMAQMGELVSMIAHQWKQPLSQIGAISSTFKIKLELERFDLQSDEGKREFSSKNTSKHND